MASNAVRNLYKIHVSNLPWTVGSTELRKYFSKFGHVVVSNVAFDKNTGLSRNYGFITFSSRESFENATNVTHKLEGNVIKVQASTNN